VALNKNFSKGLFMKGSYTWGKALNMADDDGWTGLKAYNWEPVIARNYSPASYDRRHMFTLGWVFELPFGAGKRYDFRGVADKILGGWKINGVFSAYTGTPFTVTGSGNALRCNSCGTQTADQLAPVRKIDTERGPNKPYYDPTSFMDPLIFYNKTGVYRFGTMGINALYGPGFWRFDPAVIKEFRISERVRSEFRWEATNLTNTPRWNNPNGGAASPTRDADGNILSLQNFMSITGAGGLREFRMSARLQF
jgi:hypothetical protein